MSIYNGDEGPVEIVSNDEKLMSMLIYLLSFVTTVVGPVIIWAIKRGESDFVDYHGKQYLNFMISYAIYGLISGLLVIIVIGGIMLAVLAIAGFIFTIIAAVKSYGGERYQIPLIIRFIK